MAKNKTTKKKHKNEHVITSKTNYVVPEKLHDVLIGKLLGDGCLGTATGKTWSYRGLQGEAQKDYLFHVYNLMKEWCLSEPSSQEVTNQIGKKRRRWYFNTRRLGILKPSADLFYVREQTSPTTWRWLKRVPPNIEDLLTPTALAYWFMDDGDQKWKHKSKAVRISTQGFTKQDCELLCQALTNKYGLQTKLVKAEVTSEGVQQYRLYISSKSYNRLRDLIYSELLPSLRYKFPNFH